MVCSALILWRYILLNRWNSFHLPFSLESDPLNWYQLNMILHVVSLGAIERIRWSSSSKYHFVLYIPGNRNFKAYEKAFLGEKYLSFAHETLKWSQLSYCLRTPGAVVFGIISFHTVDSQKASVFYLGNFFFSYSALHFTFFFFPFMF